MTAFSGSKPPARNTVVNCDCEGPARTSMDSTKTLSCAVVATRSNVPSMVPVNC